MKVDLILIDDDPVALFLYTETLKEDYFFNAPQTFIDATKCLDYLSNSIIQEPVIILLDLNMPVMNGWEFLEAISQLNNRHSVFVFILTSSVNEADKQKSKNYERVFGFFEKPLTDENIETIKKVMELGFV